MICNTKYPRSYDQQIYDILWRPNEHKIFRQKYSTKHFTTKWTFDKMTLRQKAFSTKWFSRQGSFDEVSYICVYISVKSQKRKFIPYNSNNIIVYVKDSKIVFVSHINTVKGTAILQVVTIKLILEMMLYCYKHHYIVAVVISIYKFCSLTLLHSERPKLHTILAFLSAIRLI